VIYRHSATSPFHSGPLHWPATVYLHSLPTVFQPMLQKDKLVRIICCHSGSWLLSHEPATVCENTRRRVWSSHV